MVSYGRTRFKVRRSRGHFIQLLHFRECRMTKELLREIASQDAKDKEDCAKGREAGSKESRTPKSPYQWTWELWKEKQQTGDMQCSDWSGRGTAWCFGMSRGWNKATRQYQQISARLDEVSEGQEPALWAEEPPN